ncbi:MAG: prepilin-type N-terminal cleavage/methylation domain-containing protein [Trueperaceae bacterium]|nr:prepilin-type N-terminal cleavage/methylation domain-containing protein [Trueperaceae bacterium]
MHPLFRRGGFTLIEVLVVIAIVAVLAAVLIPVVLAPRGLAYDTATQTCLKEVGTRQEAIATESPFEYDPAFDPSTVAACEGVNVTVDHVEDDDYRYTGLHDYGEYLYEVTPGTPVKRVNE